MRKRRNHPARYARSDAWRRARIFVQRTTDIAPPAGKTRPSATRAGSLRPRSDENILSARRFSGRWDGGKVWVEALPPAGSESGPARGGDSVSPIIIGGNIGRSLGGRRAGTSTCGCDAGRRRATRDGVPVRDQRGHVRADGQLQDRPGPCLRTSRTVGPLSRAGDEPLDRFAPPIAAAWIWLIAGWPPSRCSMPCGGARAARLARAAAFAIACAALANPLIVRENARTSARYRRPDRRSFLEYGHRTSPREKQMRQPPRSQKNFLRTRRSNCGAPKLRRGRMKIPARSCLRVWLPRSRMHRRTG